MSRSFNSKILLFGEYSLVRGGKALALPFHTYRGEFSPVDKSNATFNSLLSFLENSTILSNILDLGKFSLDIKEGIIFKSNIPQGMGVGSSGALCAAIYYRYRTIDLDQSPSGLRAVMDYMSLMESFYHGASSGLDPLVSLIDKPILVENRNHVTLLDSISCENLYLYNTQISRKTSPLVMHYMELCDSESFKEYNDELININSKLIEAFINKDFSELNLWFYKLSKWQYIHFSKMIDESIRGLWLEGLETKKFFFKLCGAGGGGHYMVYSNDLSNVSFAHKLVKIN